MTNSKTADNLYEMIDDLEIGMLVSEHDGSLRSRPMKFFTDENTNRLWCLTKFGSDKVIEIVTDSDVNISFSCPKSQNYVSVTGKAFVTRDQDKIDMMWSDSMEVWFECSKSDPNVAAIEIIPSIAEYWDGKSSKIARIWEIAKSKVTGDTPDMGDNAKIKLAG